jgi:hypothetical protein
LTRSGEFTLCEGDSGSVTANAPKHKKIKICIKILPMRSIEDFWEFLKANVYENNWSAKNATHLCLQKRNFSFA